MATTADFKNGMTIEFNGQFVTIVQFQHVKPGKGPAFVRTKLKNVKTGKVIENTFNSGVRVDVVRISFNSDRAFDTEDIISNVKLSDKRCFFLQTSWTFCRTNT